MSVYDQGTNPPVPARPNLPVSVTRTVIPFVAGWLVTLAVRKWGVTIDNDTVASLLTTVFGSVYYVLVRFLESHKASFGWLLGVAKRPAYPVIEVTNREAA
jgi:hypothetical protein